MKKIGILTLFGYNNYGNRLQMYANQMIYRKLCFEPEIIRHKIKIGFLKKYILEMKKIIKGLIHLKKWILILKREKNFKENSKNKFKESKKKVNSGIEANKLLKNYDYFSIGSDQIWHPNNYNRLNFVFFKEIPCKNKIAFSPSFSVNELPEEYKEKYKECLETFKYLSIRENEGQKIIKCLIGKEVPVLLDPTMTLEKKDWIEFKEICDIKPKNKYILTYFLGEISEKANSILKKYKEEGYERVKLNSFDMPEYYAINPSEWVDFVNDASLFLTDSFHGVAFAHILETPFAVYNRIGGEGMSSRITTILKKFNTEDRFELSVDTKDLFEMKFTGVDKILEDERKKTYDFLKNALGDS